MESLWSKVKLLILMLKKCWSTTKKSEANKGLTFTKDNSLRVSESYLKKLRIIEALPLIMVLILIVILWQNGN